MEFSSISTSSQSHTNLDTRFEVEYIPLSDFNPKIPVFRSIPALPQNLDGTPPEYSEIEPAYYFTVDRRTQRAVIKDKYGQAVADISFINHKEPMVNAVEASGKETTRLEQHRFFRPKGTSFTTSRGHFQWSKPIDGRMSRSNNKASAELHLSKLVDSSRKGKKTQVQTDDRDRVVGRMGFDLQHAGIIELEMDETALSEEMFLGTVLAMLKKSDLKLSRHSNTRIMAGKHLAR